MTSKVEPAGFAGAHDLDWSVVRFGRKESALGYLSKGVECFREGASGCLQSPSVASSSRTLSHLLRVLELDAGGLARMLPKRAAWRNSRILSAQSANDFCLLPETRAVAAW